MAADADLPAVPPAPEPQAPGTRRRGETLERAIYDAVLEELMRAGLTGLTMEGVAACAHTGKAALYRRWPGKEDLVVDALDHSLPRLDDLPDHGNLRDDLLDLMRRMTATMNSRTGCALQVLMGEIDQDHPFARLLKERVFQPRKQGIVALLDRAVERGEVPPGVDTALVAEVGPAMVAQRFHADGPPVPDAYVVSVVDDVVMPLLKP
jgi:AcrR family transcriptional regulator